MMNVIILGQRHHFFCHFKSVRPVPPVPVSAPTKQEQAKSGFAGDPPSYKSRFSVYFPLFLYVGSKRGSLCVRVWL